MRIVTGCAMNFVVDAHRQFLADEVGVTQLAILVEQRPIESKSDGVIVGKILGEVGWSGWNSATTHDDWFVGGAAGHQSERERPIVTAQAHFRRTAGLIDAGVGGAASVDAIVGGRHLAIPQRGLSGRVVRRVAEDADLFFKQGMRIARTADAEVVRRTHHAFLRERRLGPCEQTCDDQNVADTFFHQSN